jgi:hypothetical protein
MRDHVFLSISLPLCLEQEKCSFSTHCVARAERAVWASAGIVLAGLKEEKEKERKRKKRGR